MTPIALAGLAVVMLSAAMAPGPDFVLVVRSAITAGRATGLCCLVGVAGLLAASASVYGLVKLGGGLYLVYLGVRSLLSAASRRERSLVPDGTGGVRPRAAFVQGLVTNLLNPKTAVFFIALLPQFLPDDVSVLALVQLCLLTSLVTLCWFSLLAVAVHGLRRFVSRPSFRRVIDAVTGSLLVALGARIAVHR